VILILKNVLLYLSFLFFLKERCGYPAFVFVCVCSIEILIKPIDFSEKFIMHLMPLEAILMSSSYFYAACFACLARAVHYLGLRSNNEGEFFFLARLISSYVTFYENVTKQEQTFPGYYHTAFQEIGVKWRQCCT
jgi:hypothetical protein